MANVIRINERRRSYKKNHVRGTISNALQPDEVAKLVMEDLVREELEEDVEERSKSNQSLISLWKSFKNGVIHGSGHS